VTLAVCAMSQPAGKVCGASSRFGIYLRSSPLFCFADILSVLIRLAPTSFRHQVSPVQSVERLIVERFDGAPTDENLKAMRSAMWARWVFFVLGGLPQAVKLYSFRGLVWTKILGSIFLASILMIEVLNSIYLFRLCGNSRAILLVRSNDAAELYGKLYDLCLFILSLVCTWLFMFFVLISGCDSFFKLAFYQSYRDHHAGYKDMLDISILTSINLFGIGLVIFYLRPVLELLYPDAIVRRRHRPFIAFCLANLILCAISYWLFYDPEGTENPGWTAVFG